MYSFVRLWCSHSQSARLDLVSWRLMLRFSTLIPNSHLCPAKSYRIVYKNWCTIVGTCADNPPGDPDTVQTTKTTTGAVGFYHGFIAAFAVMIVSEIGDKTFFIAAIMVRKIEDSLWRSVFHIVSIGSYVRCSYIFLMQAMRHNRFTIFSGAISALAVMTVLSTYVGQIATFIPRIYTHYISTLLFFVFGIRMLYDSQSMVREAVPLLLQVLHHWVQMVEHNHLFEIRYAEYQCWCYTQLDTP